MKASLIKQQFKDRIQKFIQSENQYMKKAARLSRFSVNVNTQLLKNLQSFISRQATEDRDKSSITNDHLQSLTTTRRSIGLEDKRTSKDIKVADEGKQQKEEDLFSKENNSKKDKYYDIDEINKYRRSMFELPNLHDKNKKTKFKYITAEFIEFLFQILKSIDIIQKIYSSSVPQESVMNEFFNILTGFQIKTVQGGKSLEFNREQDYFHILIQGAAEKVVVKQTLRSQRKSSLSQYFSESSIVRRSKLKNKTITQKGKMICFQNNMPILANEKQLVACTLKTIGDCKFLLLDKGVWAKFLLALQKLQEKHLIGFIKQCTTINLNTYTKKQLKQNKEEKKVKRKFLHQLKFPNQQYSDDEQDTDENYKKASERKLTNYGNSLSFSYKLFTASKDDKITVNNQDVYLIVKGSMHLLTDSYSMIISQGSIINSSILMNLNYKSVQAKALVECLLVKIILDQIYFTKEDQNQFIAKIQQIQEFRVIINCKNHLQSNECPDTLRKTLCSPNEFNDVTQLQIKLRNSLSQKNHKFQPKQLIIKELSFIKGNQTKKKSPRKQRIHHCKKIHTQPQSQQTQLARKVAVKYANNICIFEKIVQSEQKVIEAYNMNKVKKLFPIQDLLKNINFAKFLQKHCHEASKQSGSLKVNPSQINKTSESSDKENMPQENCKDLFKGSIKLSKGQDLNNFHQERRKESLEKLRKQREIFGKSLMEKKKKQKAKVIDNLFEINLTQQNQKGNQGDRSLRESGSLNFHKERIKQIVSRNSLMKMKELNSERTFVDFRGSTEETLDYMNRTDSMGKKSKYNRQFLVTDPNYAEVRTLQKAISGQKLSAQSFLINFCSSFRKTNTSQQRITKMNLTADNNVFSEDYVKLRKRTTKRIQTTMLTGRIRQSKGQQ